MPRSVLLVAFILVVVTNASHAQSDENGWQFGIGLGAAKVTGTPERPGPRDGYLITGAGSASPAPHIRAFAEKAFKPWMYGRAEVFGNRFRTPNKTFNCLARDWQGIPNSRTCYPAAEIDRSVGVLVGSRIGLLERRFRPSIQLAAGVAHYTLTANQDWFYGLQGTTSVRPVFKVGIGAGIKVKSFDLLFETGLLGSLGDGGGADQIPFTINILWR
jgi:hypothetical protein